MNAYAMLARCSAHQLDPDGPMRLVLAEHLSLATLRPNLMLATSPLHACGADCEREHGCLMPVLTLREG